MTRTISLITATVGAALLFAVPAWGDNWGADQRSESVGYLSPDAADRAAALGQQKTTDMLNAREGALTAKYDAQVGSTPVRDSREIVVDDRFRLHPQSVSTPVTATSSGREIDLPQIGIGFGFGLLLALGLYLAMRFTRIRPLAH
jgi:hypothetical protein